MRRPARIELRAGTVGIASGNARSKLKPSRASASIAGVRAPSPYTWSTLSVSATISSTFGRSLRAAGGHPASDAAAAAPAPATRNWRRVGTSRDSRTSSALSVSRCKGADRRRPRAPSHRVSRTSFGCRPLQQAPAAERAREVHFFHPLGYAPTIDSTVGATARVEANHQAGQVLELERLVAEAVLARDLLKDRVGPLSRAGS